MWCFMFCWHIHILFRWKIFVRACAVWWTVMAPHPVSETDEEQEVDDVADDFVLTTNSG